MQNTWCETSGSKDLDTKQAEVYRPFKSGYFCLMLFQKSEFETFSSTSTQSTVQAPPLKPGS